MEPVIYVLDACAMIAYLRSEPGAEVVSHLAGGTMCGACDQFL